MSTINFPVFGRDGQLEGELAQPGATVGQGSPPPMPRFPATERARAEELSRAVRRAVNPKLADAIETEERALATVAHWEARAVQLRSALNVASDRVKTTSPGQPGLAEERRTVWRTLEAEYEEAREELEAAREELEQATARVQAVTA
jgi:septal ring factor EnvC (AmiA/AmiB activator)